jgi:hypothetical protein
MILVTNIRPRNVFISSVQIWTNECFDGLTCMFISLVIQKLKIILPQKICSHKKISPLSLLCSVLSQQWVLGQVNSVITSFTSVVSIWLIIFLVFAWNHTKAWPSIVWLWHEIATNGLPWDWIKVSVMRKQHNVELYFEAMQYWWCNFLPRCHTEVIRMVAARRLHTRLCPHLQDVLVTIKVRSAVFWISYGNTSVLIGSRPGIGTFITNSVPKLQKQNVTLYLLVNQ